MRFRPSLIDQYYKKWESASPTPLSQSNPQPFTVAELEGIIGKSEELFDPQLELGFATTEGSETLRTSIADLYDQARPANIVTFAGAQEAIYCSIQALLAPGDKVAAITPIFEPLIASARDLKCEIQLIPLQAGEHWKLDLNKLEDVVKSGCRLLILNFPHNPTGAMISKAELFQIIKICDRYNCWILSDEVFRGLEYQPESRLPSVAEIYPKAISIGVLSKAFALPALRIGWVSCQNSAILERLVEIKNYLSICNSLLDEVLAIRVLQNYEVFWDRNRKIIVRHFHFLNDFMARYSSQFQFIKPQAGCTAFPILRGDQPAIDYSEQLIRSKNIMVLPNELFFTPINGFRLGFGYANQLDKYALLC